MNIKIGNTPLIKIKYRYNGKENNIFVKLEYYNLTGSIKDRVAYYIIKQAYGNPVHIFMPDWVSKERLNLMKMYDAKVTLISKEEGGFKRAIMEANEYAKKNNAFFSNQFENKNNVLAHYETTGKEIIDDMNEEIGGFVSGIGTGRNINWSWKKTKRI